MAGAVVYFTITFLRLEWATRRLPYLLLGRQSAPSVSSRGLFIRLSDFLTQIDSKVSGTGSYHAPERKDGARRAVRPGRR